MGHTNSTTNYNLTQFVGTDKPAWLEDYNGDMLSIDTNMKAISDIADAAKTEADQGAIDIAAVTITANSANSKSTDALSNYAGVYDSTSTYSIGELTLYNNILYKALTNITVPESFTPAHWNRVNLDDLMSSIESKINSINSKFNNMILRLNITVHSLSLASWGNHYYQDVDIAGYISSGYTAIDCTIADGISGGILSAYLKADNHTVRFLNDNPYTGDQSICVICVKNAII